MWLNFYILRAYFWSFNPHTYMRCDSMMSPFWQRILQFQSTHLHEVWHQQRSHPLSMRSFNPHTYMRCDTTKILQDATIHSFNPHTYMRCDLEREYLDKVQEVSIHTPTWGVTRRYHPKKSNKQFQSTHLHEVWLEYELQIESTSSFNPHTYMRCDYLLLHIVCLIPCFNPHTYMRCDVFM